MDDPELDAGRHLQALRGLARLNRFSRADRILWGPIRRLASRVGSAPLRVLDIATGAGDLPVRLWRRAGRDRSALEIEGCDRSPQAVAYARRRAERAGAPVRFFEWDLLERPVPSGYDLILCSLFLHHLDEDRVVGLLRGMTDSARRMVLVSDLRRSPAGLALAAAGARLLSRSDVVQADGPRSVRAAYTIPEVRELLRRAGRPEAQVLRRWPFRFLLIWERG